MPTSPDAASPAPERSTTPQSPPHSTASATPASSPSKAGRPATQTKPSKDSGQPSQCRKLPAPEIFRLVRPTRTTGSAGLLVSPVGLVAATPARENARSPGVNRHAVSLASELQHQAFVAAPSGRRGRGQPAAARRAAAPEWSSGCRRPWPTAHSCSSESACAGRRGRATTRSVRSTGRGGDVLTPATAPPGARSDRPSWW